MPTARVLDALQVFSTPSGDGSDGDCLARFLDGRDEAAFAELVRRHGPMVYGACRRVLANGPEADDAFQATFFVLARKADTIRGNVRSWLYGVAVRVSQKARVQAVRRRVRQMAAAKPEAVLSPPTDRDLWAVLDEELARLPEELRQAILACDLNGLSRSKAAAELGWPEGTVVKRLTKARETLAARLTRRGISLGGGALAIALAETATAAVPGALLLDTARQAVSFAFGGGGGSHAVQNLAEGVMRSLKMSVLKVWFAVGLLAVTLAGGGLMLAEGPGESKGGPPAAAAVKPEPGKAGTMWKERYAVEYTGSLPVSVAFSPDGKLLLTGDTAGEVMALILGNDNPTYRWKTKVEGSHAAAAYSADGKRVYATTRHGVRVLDAADGKEVGRIEAKDSNPIALGVFPFKLVGGMLTQTRIVFGNSRGYSVKFWFENVANSNGTIETSTAAKGAAPKDPAAVPLAVDPKGRSAIMTGPLDPETKTNVLWAYVCGDYEKGSPGNRVMAGHEATVVSAAWAKDGATAVTGDADGRVIVWDAATMKETRRVELGSRVAALAISDDGRRTAAYVLGKTGEVFVWDTAKPSNAPKPIHTDPSEFAGPSSHASLSFSPDGKRLAGCASDLRLLNFLGRLNGKVRVWELAAEPKSQLPPKHLYTIPLPKGSSSNFVIQHNHVMIAPSAKEGAIDYRDPRDGTILSRLVLGKFAIGKVAMSSDKQWMAAERHPAGNGFGVGIPAQDFVADIWDMKAMKRDASIPGVSRILDVEAGRTAIVREKKVEIWDNVTCKLVKAAPFAHARIDAARFSPDGKTLAISDQNELVLWRWVEGAHERIELGRTVGSLAFSPDGKLLAEGPSPRENIVIRDVATRQIAKSLVKGNRVWMNVPRLLFTQGGRVLIAVDSIEVAKNVPAPHRIHLWDTQTGEIAHEIAIPSGVPKCIDVSPNGRYLIATIEDESGLKLSAWEIGGGAADPVRSNDPPRKVEPPATIAPPTKLAWKAEEPLADPEFDIQALAFSKDGAKFAICSNGETLVYDSAARKQLYTASGCFPRFVGQSLFTWAIVPAEFHAETGKLLKTHPEPKPEFGWQLAAFSPDGKTTAGFDGAQVQLRDVATGFEPRRLQRQSRPTNTSFPMKGVAWSPDGKLVAGFHHADEGGTGGLAVWDAATGHQLARRSAGLLEFNGPHAGFAFAPDGKTIAVGGLTGDNQKNSSLTILDATTLKNVVGPIPVRSRDGGSDVTAIAYSPDGRTVAIGVKLHTGKGPLNRVQLYDAKALELGESLLPPHDTAPISSLAFAPDGRTLIGTTGEGPFSEPQQKETLHRVLIWRGEQAK